MMQSILIILLVIFILPKELFSTYLQVSDRISVFLQKETLKNRHMKILQTSHLEPL